MKEIRGYLPNLDFPWAIQAQLWPYKCFCLGEKKKKKKRGDAATTTLFEQEYKQVPMEKQLKADSLMVEIIVYARETVCVLEKTRKTLKKRVEEPRKATVKEDHL